MINTNLFFILKRKQCFLYISSWLLRSIKLFETLDFFVVSFTLKLDQIYPPEVQSHLTAILLIQWKRNRSFLFPSINSIFEGLKNFFWGRFIFCPSLHAFLHVIHLSYGTERMGIRLWHLPLHNYQPVQRWICFHVLWNLETVKKKKLMIYFAFLQQHHFHLLQPQCIQKCFLPCQIPLHIHFIVHTICLCLINIGLQIKITTHGYYF